MDYVLSGIQIAAPSVLAMNSKAGGTYRALGAGYLALNALSDTPVGIRRSISMKSHKKSDMALLAGLSLLTLSNFIRKDKKALRFHLALLAVGLAQFILTDYSSRR